MFILRRISGIIWPDCRGIYNEIIEDWELASKGEEIKKIAPFE